MQKNNLGFAHIIIPILILAVLVAAGAYWYFAKYKGQSEPPVAEGLGAKVYEQAQNPVKDKLPSTNPFEEVKVNPFE